MINLAEKEPVGTDALLIQMAAVASAMNGASIEKNLVLPDDENMLEQFARRLGRPEE